VATEVELKAHIEDPGAIEEKVRAFARFSKDYDRRDIYFHVDGLDPAVTDFRLRRDTGAAVVTFKRKSINKGVEANEEREFEVSDADAFASLAERIGCTVFARKHKTGRSYRSGEATIEISSVEGLGYFIEIEILLSSPEPAAIERADAEVRSILERVGVPSSSIEPRNYIDMLA
jgi:adenylate cyclase class 2